MGLPEFLPVLSCRTLRVQKDISRLSVQTTNNKEIFHCPGKHRTRLASRLTYGLRPLSWAGYTERLSSSPAFNQLASPARGVGEGRLGRSFSVSYAAQSRRYLDVFAQRNSNAKPRRQASGSFGPCIITISV